MLQAFLSERISGDDYGDYYKGLCERVLELNTAQNDPMRYAAAAAAAAASASEEGFVPYSVDPSAGSGLEDTSGKASAGIRGFIAPSVEPRFVAHRLWSLYESMFYSDYIATRLDTWRVEAGALLHGAIRWPCRSCVASQPLALELARLSLMGALASSYAIPFHFPAPSPLQTTSPSAGWTRCSP